MGFDSLQLEFSVLCIDASSASCDFVGKEKLTVILNNFLCIFLLAGNH